jgi:hypothetical protein
MELGDSNTAERNERSQLDMVLDKLNGDLAELLEAIESGGLDQLTAAQKISFWQKVETLRNRLPLIDHQLIADAQASDLAGEYCFSNLTIVVDPHPAAVPGRGRRPGAGRRSTRTACLSRR